MTAKAITLKSIFERKAGYFMVTENDAMMEKVGKVLMSLQYQIIRSPMKCVPKPLGTRKISFLNTGIY